MSSICKQRKFVCSGVVVETFEKGGEHRARVSLKPTCVEVPMVAHLGDIVVIDGNISITAVGPAVTAQNSRRSHRSHSKGGMA